MDTTDNYANLGQPVFGTFDRLYPAPRQLDHIFDIAMRRPRALWLPIEIPHTVRPESRANRYLHFGGENKIIDGYREINYPEWDAEKFQPFPLDSGTVESVICIHTVDHLSSTAVQFWLKDMERLLHPGGVITIVVPHFMSTLAHECIEHKTQYGLKTFKNILGGGNDVSVDFRDEGDWRRRLSVGYNMVMGVEERNLVLVTQLVKEN